MEDITQKFIDPRDLIPYDNNSKKHSAEVIEKLADSMLEIGFRRSVSITKNNIILAVHKSVKACILNIERGYDDFNSIPVTVSEKITDAQLRAFVLGENRQGELSEWDFEAVRLELEALEEMDFDIELTGFDFEDINFNPNNELDDKDEFKSVDVEELAHECPKCGYEFN